MPLSSSSIIQSSGSQGSSSRTQAITSTSPQMSSSEDSSTSLTISTASPPSSSQAPNSSQSPLETTTIPSAPPSSSMSTISSSLRVTTSSTTASSSSTASPSPSPSSSSSSTTRSTSASSSTTTSTSSSSLSAAPSPTTLVITDTILQTVVTTHRTIDAAPPPPRTTIRQTSRVTTTATQAPGSTVVVQLPPTQDLTTTRTETQRPSPNTKHVPTTIVIETTNVGGQVVTTNIITVVPSPSLLMQPVSNSNLTPRQKTALIAGSVGGVVGIILCVLFIWLCMRRFIRHNNEEKEEEDGSAWVGGRGVRGDVIPRTEVDEDEEGLRNASMGSRGISRSTVRFSPVLGYDGRHSPSSQTRSASPFSFISASEAVHDHLAPPGLARPALPGPCHTFPLTQQPWNLNRRVMFASSTTQQGSISHSDLSAPHHTELTPPMPFAPLAIVTEISRSSDESSIPPGSPRSVLVCSNGVDGSDDGHSSTEERVDLESHTSLTRH